MRLFALIFFRLITLLMIFALLIAVAQAIGWTQPPPDALASLHLTECTLPCWMGITPGVTTFDEALARVSAVYPLDVTVDESQIFVGYLIDRSRGAANIQLSNGIVNAITLVVSDVPGIQAGNVSALFGTPECILSQFPPVLIYQIGDVVSLVVAYGGQTARWRQPLNSIEVNRVGDQARAGLCSGENARELPWSGG